MAPGRLCPLDDVARICRRDGRADAALFLSVASGINRVGGSDVAIGSRIPGAGRFYYVSGEYRW